MGVGKLIKLKERVKEEKFRELSLIEQDIEALPREIEEDIRNEDRERKIRTGQINLDFRESAVYKRI